MISVPYYIDKNVIVNPKENILFDDYDKNIDKWNKSVGVGIHLDKEKRIDRLLINHLKN